MQYSLRPVTAVFQNFLRSSTAATLPPLNWTPCLQNSATGWRGGNLEYGFNLIPVFATSGNQSVKGGGFEPVVLRWNSASHIGRAVPYIELAGGGVFTTSNLPAGDTSSFNFTAKGGGGVYIFTKERQSLDIGCRWWHISNANLGVRNPEFNGVQVTLGYHWFKSRASSRAQ